MKPLFVLTAFLAVVAADVVISDFKVGILAKDQQPGAENLKNLPIFSKLPNNLKADASQRLYISFAIAKKADNSKIHPQQVFLRFEAENGEDAIIVVDPTSNGAYVHDMVLRTASKLLRNLNGKLKTSLLVGDASIKNPVNWYFMDLEVNLPGQPESIPKSQQVHYEARPEIRHVFRQLEKRPAAAISDLFTIVCLSPLLLLVALWSKIGINFEQVPASPWVPIFHVGLTAIFGLYFFFWIQLDMFETLKYLALFGFLTFVAGNRVLRALAGDKLKSE